jgi:hypothetical protein
MSEAAGGSENIPSTARATWSADSIIQMRRPPTRRSWPRTEPPWNAIRNTAWTQPLKWSFLGLQVAGLYLVVVILLLLVVGLFIVLSLAATILGKTDPNYLDVVRVLLLYASEQPLLVVVPPAAMVASIVTTRAAFRQQAWAHWAAMALVAASIVPFILIAIAFRDWIWWLIAVPYSAACVAFLAAMTYTAARYGPWGATRPGAEALAAPPTL